MNPQREEFAEIRAKLLHGNREGKMVRLRELIGEHETQLGSPLADNYLSERAASKAEIARAKGYVLLDEIDALWRDLCAQFERAVLDGDATCLEELAKAMRSRDTRSETDKARDQFDAAVARKLEMGFWVARAEEEKRAKEEKREPKIDWSEIESAVIQVERQRKLDEQLKKQRDKKPGYFESATLTPAGKRVNFAGPQQVLNELGVQKIIKAEKAVGFGPTKTLMPRVACVLVCGCRFASERRAREAVEAVRKRLKYEWKKASNG